MENLRLVLSKHEKYEYGLEESYFLRNIHTQNKLFKMLPYSTSGKDKDYVVDFTGVVGEFIRVLGNKKISEQLDINRFNNNIIELVTAVEEKEELLNIINKLFINNSKLAMFDLKSYYYLNSTGSEAKMAHFLYTLLINEQEKVSFQALVNESDSNILHKLVYEALPTLQHIEYSNDFKNNIYECVIPLIKRQFIADFRYLIKTQDMVDKYLKRLLEYYYMFYVTQLAVKLNDFETADLEKVEKIYMTLSWEVASQTRRSYEYGWQFVKEHIDKLFSHAITFEILAHNNIGNKYTYCSIDDITENYEGLVSDIDWFIEKYKSAKSDVDFTKFKFNEKERSYSELTTKVKELFQVIDYQFRNSGRRTQNIRYYDNLIKFVQTNFGKRRGRAGYSFNITEKDIIMFVQIILGQHNGRIRLVTLFEEFEFRGLLFDRESKSKIVELLEKLNLLEKKSDSGDAQYVRSIL